MSSKYFTVPSFARAKKNKEDLEKTNPKEPVLKDEDEKFFDKHIESKEAVQQGGDVPATKITDDGEEKEATKAEQEQAGDSIVIPETKPESGDGAKDEEDTTLQNPETGGDVSPESKPEPGDDAKNEQDTSETKPETGDGVQEGEEAPEEEQRPEGEAYDDTMKEKAAERVKARKEKKTTQSMELPSQEDAEAATKGFHAESKQTDERSQAEKRTWASYIPSVRPNSRKTADDSTEDTAQETERPDSRSWKEYASTYVPSMPNMLKRNPKDADSHPEPVYNADGTLNEEATKEQQEKEISVLLDNLNMSSINNRVFAFSGETQKYYERFAQVLKDIIIGGPTAYDDMEVLMKEAGPKLEEQFKNMPPFVQTLVKSLPMKMGSTLGPELMAAAASEKPGNDMNAKLAAASASSAGAGAESSGVNLASTSATDTSTTEKNEDGTAKKKRRIPGLKGLVSEKSGVATMLRSVVSFLQTRFPFLASMTNVVMSLAVFILMFVFWYCWKRGREVRLAKEQAAAAGTGTEEGEGDDDDMLEVDATDEEDEVLDELEKEIDKQGESLSQPTPAEVPMSDSVEGVSVVDKGVGEAEVEEPAPATQGEANVEGEKAAAAAGRA